MIVEMEILNLIKMNLVQNMLLVFDECYRVLESGRYICVNICDVISGERKYPITANYVSMLQRSGFDYLFVIRSGPQGKAHFG